MPVGNVLGGMMGILARGVWSGPNLSQIVLMSFVLISRAFNGLTVLSVGLPIRVTLSRPVSNMVVSSEFSSYVSMGEGSGYLSRGVCFWSPLSGVLLCRRQESLVHGSGSSRDGFREFPGRVSGVPGTTFGNF